MPSPYQKRSSVLSPVLSKKQMGIYTHLPKVLSSHLDLGIMISRSLVIGLDTRDWSPIQDKSQMER